MEENQINNLGQSPLERYQEQVKKAEQIATTFEQEMKKKAEEAAQFLYQEMIKSLRMIQEQEAAKAVDPNSFYIGRDGRKYASAEEAEEAIDPNNFYIGRDGHKYASAEATEEAIATKYYDKDITDKIKRNDNGRSR